MSGIPLVPDLAGSDPGTFYDLHGDDIAEPEPHGGPHVASYIRCVFARSPEEALSLDPRATVAVPMADAEGAAPRPAADADADAEPCPACGHYVVGLPPGEPCAACEGVVWEDAPEQADLPRVTRGTAVAP